VHNSCTKKLTVSLPQDINIHKLKGTKSWVPSFSNPIVQVTIYAQPFVPGKDVSLGRTHSNERSLTDGYTIEIPFFI